MTKIYWTTRKTEDGNTAVMAISVSDLGLGFSMTTDDEGNNALDFPTDSLAENYVKELNKPRYYELFGFNYELIHLENNSDEWYEVYNKYKNTISMIDEIRTFTTLPWWKRMFYDYKKITRYCK